MSYLPVFLLFIFMQSSALSLTKSTLPTKTVKVFSYKKDADIMFIINGYNQPVSIIINDRYGDSIFIMDYDSKNQKNFYHRSFIDTTQESSVSYWAELLIEYIQLQHDKTKENNT